MEKRKATLADVLGQVRLSEVPDHVLSDAKRFAEICRQAAIAVTLNKSLSKMDRVFHGLALRNTLAGV